ncbi:helix-turn-helix transcriptional regulator [Bacillus sp. FJAT-52991]|uniref:Helix-turn-helix transcriptional regulator n=1 Tax=Bacillus kandeliae TaxID=3129297 RepID=A0ABZ2N816_9BACI
MDAQTFRNVRLYLGYDQSEFAKLLGVRNTYVSMMENGTKPVSDAVRMKIARQFTLGRDFVDAVEAFSFLGSLSEK